MYVKSFYPGYSENFIIFRSLSEGADIAAFFEGNLNYGSAENELKASSSGFYEYVWNEVAKKWTLQKEESREYWKVSVEQIESILYCSENISAGTLTAAATEIIMRGRGKIEGFSPNPKLDFTQFVTGDEYESKEFFILEDEDAPTRIKLDPRDLVVYGNDKLIKMKITAPFFAYDVFKMRNWMRNMRVNGNFQSFYPYTFIIGGTREKKDGDKLICPKLEFMAAEDLNV